MGQSTNGKLVHIKEVHRGNTNQNNRDSLSPQSDYLSSRIQTTTNADEDTGKRNSIHYW
jgi:hypothetical protein